MADGMKLGQFGDRKDEGTWFFIRAHKGQYVLWAEDEDAEYREILGIDAEDQIPQIRVRRFHHPSRSQYQRKQLMKYRKLGHIPDEIEQKVIKDSVANEVLLDWRLIDLGDGVQPYSPELGSKALKIDEDFYDAVVMAALEENSHRDKATAEDAEALGNE